MSNSISIVFNEVDGTISVTIWKGTNAAGDMNYYLVYDKAILPEGYPSEEFIAGFNGKLFFPLRKNSRYLAFTKIVEDALT